MNHYKPYPQYKDSGVEWLGEVPEHWASLRLRNVATFRNSNVDKKTYPDGIPVELCNYTDVYYNEFFIDELPLMKATATSNEIINHKLEMGDVIFTRDSESADDIGIPTLVKSFRPNTVCGYHLTVLKTDSEMLPEFAHRLFQSATSKYHFLINCPGITRVGLSVPTISNTPALLPPLAEQRAIADFLDRETTRIDALIEKKSRFIELLEEKRQALISHAVIKGLDPNVPMKDSGVEWLGEVPEHWEVKKLRYVSTFMGGGTPSKDKPEFWNGEIPWLSPKDMKFEQLTTSQDTITRKGLQNSSSNIVPKATPLIVTRSGILQHTIPIGITTIPMAINQDLKAFILSPDKTIPDFFLRWVQGLNKTLLFLWRKVGPTVESVEHEYVVNSEYLLPPLSEQHSIIEYLEKETARIDQLHDSTQRSIDLLREKRSALITAAVTGQIDVRAEVA